MSLLSTRETAELLGVSGATVRNWCRAGHIEPVTTHPLVFSRTTVLSLGEKIRTNRFNRLRKRANKSSSERFVAPGVLDPKVAGEMEALAREALALNLNRDNLLYIAALMILRQAGEVEDRGALPGAVPEQLGWRRRAVASVMDGWRARLEQPPQPLPENMLDPMLSRPDMEDRLGLLYQTLSSEGERARAGAYFTPREIIDDSLEAITPDPESFLDPCCGTGRYLLRAAARFRLDPSRLHGFDTDPIAADIARVNLLLHYRDMDAAPNIECLDALRDLATGQPGCATNHLLGAVDAVATNPPWGGSKNPSRHRGTTAIIRSGESFALFMEKSLHMVREGGTLSFVLPESVLKIKAHADIRRLLLETTRIRRITLLGRVFAGVFTPVIRLDVEKRAPEPRWSVTVIKNGSSHQAPQSRFLANAGHSFDVAVTPRDGELLDKIYSREHHLLRDNADWALGIVTGDNGRCVLDCPEEGAEPVLRGRDVFKFAPRRPRCYIRFIPDEFQQVAPERFYRAPEKLIYRFVSDRLVFAYDDKGTLTLNSANILIPRIPGLSIKAVMAFLNSRVFHFIFCKRFRTRKILRGDLEVLPFPVLDRARLRAIEEQVDRCMGGDYKPEEELDDMIFDAFGLTRDDIALLDRAVEIEADAVFL